MLSIKKGGLDSHNKNNDELCHWINCRKHVKLTESFGGKFCSKHMTLMHEIRNNNKHNETAHELDSRLAELLIRKNMCDRHVSRCVSLNNKLFDDKAISLEEYIINMNVIISVKISRQKV